MTQHHLLVDLDVLQADCLKLSCNDGLSDLYGPLALHVLPASLHCMVTNAFKGIINIKPFHPAQQLEFKPQHN